MPFCVQTLAKRVDVVDTPVNIALVGKYNGLSDSYLSVLKVRDQAHPGAIPPLS